MKIGVLFLGLIMASSSLYSDDYKPKLFKSTKLVYEDDFSSGEINKDFWQVRQGSTWVIKDGILTGSPSPKEFQDKKIAAGDKAHAGFKPVMWLEKVPENLVVHLRLRYDSEKYHPRFPLLDVGHHVNSLIFGEKSTRLVLKKNQKTIEVEEQFLPLNTWVDVMIELKKGVMFLKMGDKTKTFEDPLIDMVDQQQIDFKGVDFGGIQIDSVKVYEGIE